MNAQSSWNNRASMSAYPSANPRFHKRPADFESSQYPAKITPAAAPKNSPEERKITSIPRKSGPRRRVNRSGDKQIDGGACRKKGHCCPGGSDAWIHPVWTWQVKRHFQCTQEAQEPKGASGGKRARRNETRRLARCLISWWLVTPMARSATPGISVLGGRLNFRS